MYLLAAITATVLVTGCAKPAAPAGADASGHASASASASAAAPHTAASDSAAASATPAPGATIAASTSAPAPGNATHFAVTGTVYTSPACPGPVSAGSPCPDRPLADAKIEAMLGTTLVATTRTDPDGHYRLTLRRGTYRITATGTSGFRSHAARTITVPPDVVVDLTIDSGMR